MVVFQHSMSEVLRSDNDVNLRSNKKQPKLKRRKATKIMKKELTLRSLILAFLIVAFVLSSTPILLST